MCTFERIIAIDWSGAAQHSDGVDIRIAHRYAAGNDAAALVPPRSPARTRWSRDAVERWLLDELGQEHSPRTLIVFDFAMGLPWKSDRALFQCEGWSSLIKNIAALFQPGSISREVASAINTQNLPGPFRFNESRNEHRFYLNQDVAYYRLAEMAAPQSISPWYVGSGATVGLQTLTGLAMIHRILENRRAHGWARDLVVWPHEGITPNPDAHVFAECYPAMSPSQFVRQDIIDRHARDALRVAAWLGSLNAHRWPLMFELPRVSFGRYAGVTLEDQIRFEGWILGIH